MTFMHLRISCTKLWAASTFAAVLSSVRTTPSSNTSRCRFFATAMPTSQPAPKDAVKPQGALIFLHGLGDSPAGWSSLQQQLPRIQPRLANIEYVFPAAPIIPLAINGGARMPGWFDLYDWPIEVGATDDRKQKLEVGVAAIQAAVDKLVHDTGLSASSIVVGGFSQGGAVALLAAYHPTSGVKVAAADSSSGSTTATTRLAGCVSLSGWLTLVDDFRSSGSVAKPTDDSTTTPLFWGHGEYDDKVLFDHQAYGVEKLRAFGVQSIEAKSYDMGHSSDPDELVALANFVDRVIFGTKNDVQATDNPIATSTSSSRNDEL